MLARDIMPIFKPRGEVGEKREGVVESFRDLPEVLRDSATSTGRIAKPFATG